MRTIVNFILDKSGSMYGVADATISGFNEYLQTLKIKKKKHDDIFFSLTLFDTEVLEKEVVVPLSRVKKLTKQSYQPDGMTALYDAVVETVESAVEKMDEIRGKKKSLVVIMTDGMENSSTKHNEGCLRDLIKQLKKDDWTFVFLGANQDSWATTANWGLDTNNVANFRMDTVADVDTTFRNLACSTFSYASSANVKTNNFYKGKKDLSNDS